MRKENSNPRKKKGFCSSHGLMSETHSNNFSCAINLSFNLCFTSPRQQKIGIAYFSQTTEVSRIFLDNIHLITH